MAVAIQCRQYAKAHVLLLYVEEARVVKISPEPSTAVFLVAHLQLGDNKPHIQRRREA